MDVSVDDEVVRTEGGRETLCRVAAVTAESIFLNEFSVPERFRRDTGQRWGNPGIRISCVINSCKNQG